MYTHNENVQSMGLHNKNYQWIEWDFVNIIWTTEYVIIAAIVSSSNVVYTYNIAINPEGSDEWSIKSNLSARVSNTLARHYHWTIPSPNT